MSSGATAWNRSEGVGGLVPAQALSFARARVIDSNIKRTDPISDPTYDSRSFQ